MKLAIVRYLLCCFSGAEPASQRESATRIQISDIVDEAPAPIIEESRELQVESEPAEGESHSEPGQESTDRQEIVIPESRSLIFTEVAEQKKHKKAKGKRRAKEEKHRKSEGKQSLHKRTHGDESSRRFTPPPKDAKPTKSILKKR